MQGVNGVGVVCGLKAQARGCRVTTKGSLSARVSGIRSNSEYPAQVVVVTLVEMRTFGSRAASSAQRVWSKSDGVRW